MLNFCDFIQIYVFTTNHHLKITRFKVKQLYADYILAILVHFICLKFATQDKSNKRYMLP